MRSCSRITRGTSSRFGPSEPEAELTSAPAHGAQHLEREIRMSPRATQQRAHELRPQVRQQSLRRALGRRRVRGKHARKPRVVAQLAAFVQPRAAPIVLAQRSMVVGQGLDDRAIDLRRPSAGELRHEPIDELELGERRPAGVVGAPARLRLQPDGKRLGEVLGRMALRIPVLEMQHVALAPRLNRVVASVAHGGAAEDLSPVAASAQREGGVDGVAELVAQQPQAPRPVPSFGLAHHAALEAHEARVPQEERHGDAGHAVRREPFGRKPEVRLEPNAASLELPAEALRVGVHEAARELQAEVAEAQAKQRLIIEPLPAIGPVTLARSGAQGRTRRSFTARSMPQPSRPGDRRARA